MAKAANFNDYVRMVRGFNTFTNLMKCDCINGYAVGRKYTKHNPLDEIAITVFVNKKLSLRRLPISNRIPKTITIPMDKGPSLEFITDVQEARFSSLEYNARMRPIKSGYSIGHVNITAGTLGGLVQDLATGNVAVLSNNHVLADANEGAIGDPILQPGPYDGGTNPADQVATLTRFVPIDFSEGATNRVDAALATPVNSLDFLWNTEDIGPETPSDKLILSESDLGKYVHKSGRTTQHTEGFIDALFATVQIKYDLFKKATFVDQIIVSQKVTGKEFSSGGDSGSLVYDAENRVIGLLFAGSEGTETDPGTTIVNPIQFVLNELNIGLLATGAHPSV